MNEKRLNNHTKLQNHIKFEENSQKQAQKRGLKFEFELFPKKERKNMKKYKSKNHELK